MVATARLAFWVVGAVVWVSGCTLTFDADALRGGTGGAAGTGGSGTAGSGGAAHGQPGCSSAPDCPICAGCYDLCLCNAGDPSTCVGVCGIGSGGTGGAAPVGSVACGRAGCETPAAYCCLEPGSDAACRDVNTLCAAGTSMYCDGPEDCPAGATCCAAKGGDEPYTALQCAANCGGEHQEIVCGNDPSQCAPGQSCVDSPLQQGVMVCR